MANEHTGVIQQLLSNAIEADRKAQESLDQIVLVGGAGAILASVSFLSDIAKAPNLPALVVLLASWMLLAVSGLCAMRSLIATRRTATTLQDIYASMLAEHRGRMSTDEYDRAMTANTCTATQTKAAVVCFGIGILLLLVFAGANLPWKAPPPPPTSPMSVDPKTPPQQAPALDPMKRGHEFTIPSTVRPEPAPSQSPLPIPPDPAKK